MVRANGTQSIRPTAIGIDGGCWGNRRGYGRFLRQLLPHLLQQNLQWEFHLFLDEAQAVPAAPNLRVHVAETRVSVNDAATAEGARSPADLWKMCRLVHRQQLNLFFFPTVFSYFPVLNRIPISVGIHDTIADRNPKFAFAGKRQEWLWRAKVRMAIGQAKQIVTVSEYSRRSIASHFHLDASGITVVPEGAAEVFRPLDLPGEDFLLAVGGISPNKNLAMLIRVAAAVRMRLVIVGDYKGDNFRTCYDELQTLSDQLQAPVHFAGFVPDEELCQLYNRCALFVMASYDEGFGLPALEAMACGAACVVSRGHALEEVTGGAALLADPDNQAEWVAQVQQALADRETLRRRARARADAYGWAKAAETLAHSWRSLL